MILVLVEAIVNWLGGFYALYNHTRSKNRLIRKFSRLLYRCYLSAQGSFIGRDAICHGPINFPHGIKSIFISSGAEIGKNVTIFQQVTIGSNTLPDSKTKGAPTIGDGVLIGAGAIIIGNVKIGHNCRIGANAVVVEDVPDNCVVVMEKPRVIHKQQLDNTFVNWHKDLISGK